MRLTIGDWFTLPRLGKENFASLMRAGLKYDRTRGFKADEATDLFQVTSVMRDALKEEVDWRVRCLICASLIPCENCFYTTVCDRRRVSPSCICNVCQEQESPYERYMKVYAENFMQR